MKVIKDIEQGTLEWQALRRGRITGTKLAEVMGSPLDRLKLIAELIAEEGTEQTKIIKATPEMERGISEEVFARKAYAKKTKQKIEQVTMLISDKYPWFGVSPDGLIRDKVSKKYTEQIEIKNPNSSTVILYKMANKVDGCTLSKKHFLGIPEDYKWQVIASFLVNKDLKKLHFVIYDARFIEEDHRMYIITVERREIGELLNEAQATLIAFREEWLRIKEIVLPTNF